MLQITSHVSVCVFYHSKTYHHSIDAHKFEIVETIPHRSILFTISTIYASRS